MMTPSPIEPWEGGGSGLDSGRGGGNLLVLLEVGEPHEGKLVAHKGSGLGEGVAPFDLLNVVKVAGVDVTAQLWDHRGHRWGGGERGRRREERARGSKRERQREGGEGRRREKRERGSERE